MTREKAVKRLRDLSGPNSEQCDLGELAGRAFTKAAMLRDEGMKLEVSTCVQTLAVTAPSVTPNRGLRPNDPVREHRGGW